MCFCYLVLDFNNFDIFINFKLRRKKILSQKNIFCFSYYFILLFFIFDSLLNFPMGKIKDINEFSAGTGTS